MVRILLSLLLGLGVIIAPAATADSCSSPSNGWVARENSKVGSKQWNQGVPFRLSADFSRRKSANRIEGYFNATSLRCGQAAMLTLIGAPKAAATIYRTGYYQGIGARQVEIGIADRHRNRFGHGRKRRKDRKSEDGGRNLVGFKHWGTP